MASPKVIHSLVGEWYQRHARELPWRQPGTTAWGVLVSEVMSQQTPVARVEGPWRQWLARWPTPQALAEAEVAEVLRAWGSLGYPRRALRLHEAARVLAEAGNDVPADEAVLLSLPGIGRYTAAAVMAFAHRRRSVVLDTNIRRVLARLDGGVEFAEPAETAAERVRAARWLPEDDAECAAWSQAVMELGALVCTAQSPDCGTCPVREHCRWVLAGRPTWDGPMRKAQAWVGTDRQCRGHVMGALRGGDGVLITDLAWADPAQLIRCVDSLESDGLVHRAGNQLHLGPRPGGPP